MQRPFAAGWTRSRDHGSAGSHRIRATDGRPGCFHGPSILLEHPAPELGPVGEGRGRYRSRLYRLAFGITRGHAEAEEVVQDAFLALFRPSTMCGRYSRVRTRAFIMRTG